MRRVNWSITTSTQWVLSVADSQRNRSQLHKLSFAWPRNVSQEGPPEPVHGELPKLAQMWVIRTVDTIAEMRDFLILLVHLIVTASRLAGPGGLRSVVAE